jgi:hypothetical protein
MDLEGNRRKIEESEMTKTEELISAAQRNNPALSAEEARQRLIQIGVIKQGYYIEPDLSVGTANNERTSFVSGFAVVKDGEVYWEAHGARSAAILG